MEDNVDIKNWITTIIKQEIKGPLFRALSDGTLLCQLVNEIAQSKIKVQKTFNIFQKMANITNFLSFAKKIGVPDEELFMSTDLAEEKNFKQIEICLYSFSRHAVKQGLITNCIGPKLCEKRTYTFSDEVIFRGNTIMTMQNAGALDPDKKIQAEEKESLEPKKVQFEEKKK